MKKNSFKILFAALAVTAVTVACKDERNNNMVDDTVGFVMDVENAYVGISLLKESYELAIIKSGKGFQSATARLDVSELALAEYNATHGTNYVLLPAECYNISAMTIGFSKDDIRKMVDITWNDTDIAELGDDKEYAIPLQLFDEHDFPKVDQNRNLVIINPRWSYVGMASESGAAMSPAASRETKTFDGSIALDYPVTSDVTINYAVDNTLIDAYNAANGTTYLPAPDGLVSLAANSSTIAANEASTTFGVQINSSLMFEGNILKAVDNNKYLVPVRITSLSNDAIGLDRTVSYFSLTLNKTVKGPWTVLEGSEFSVAVDPANDNAEFYGQFGADKLFDGKWDNIIGDTWASYLFTQNVYPMTFVADMGEARVFTKFLVKDAEFNKNSARNFEMYTAETYDGASTVWTLVSKYKSTAEKWDNPPILFDLPVTSMAAGRYLKVVLVECAAPWTALQPARLGEIYGEGF